MFEKTKALKGFLQDKWQRAFPSTIHGSRIDVSKDRASFCSLSHVAIFDKDNQNWGVFAYYLARSRGTPGLESYSKAQLGTLETEQEAKDWLADDRSLLLENAESYLFMMGYEDPKEDFPSLTMLRPF